MQVDIYIREKGGSREIRIPWLPETIVFETGEATVASYDIMNRGPVAVPTGTDLARISWESEFPGSYRTDKSMMRGQWKSPQTYHNILKDWKASGAVLNIMVTGYPINYDVYLEDYSGEAAGGFGDIAYSVSFAEYRTIAISSVKSSSGSGSGGSSNKTTKRSTPKTTSYTIKSGDTLWGIAEKYLGGGANWEKIYNANKEIIESTAKKRWKAAGINRDSQHGHWIFPGCVITIPQ